MDKEKVGLGTMDENEMRIERIEFFRVCKVHGTDEKVIISVI